MRLNLLLLIMFLVGSSLSAQELTAVGLEGGHLHPFIAKEMSGEAIVLESGFSETILKTSNGCGIGTFIIPSIGDSMQGMPPLLGALLYSNLSNELVYESLDTILGNEIKGIVFHKNGWNENTSLITNTSAQYPLVVISDVGMFLYSIPSYFAPVSEDVYMIDSILIPNILKVAKEMTVETNQHIVLLTEDTTDLYNIQFYSYPSLEEQFQLDFHFEPEIFETIGEELFITGLDTSGVHQLYRYSIIEENLVQMYGLNDSFSNAKEITKLDDTLYILSSPGDTITMMSALNLENGAIAESIIHSNSGVRATNNEFKSEQLFTYQLMSDTSDLSLDKQILVFNPATNELNTLMIDLELDYFKHPREEPNGFGSFNLEWVAAKWEESNNDSVYIKQFDDVINVATGSMPQYINATIGCWLNVEDNAFEKVKFNFYPNPASSKVTIHLSGLLKELEYELNIIDSFGKVRYTKQLTAYQEIELPLSQFEKGVYYLSLTEGTNVIHKKLIIQ